MKALFWLLALSVVCTIPAKAGETRQGMADYSDARLNGVHVHVPEHQDTLQLRAARD
jgi:hypothetical protein